VCLVLHTLRQSRRSQNAKLAGIPENHAVMMVLLLASATGRSIALISVEQGALPMDWIRRVFHVPATETQTGIVLALCIFAMSVMSIVLVWQAQVIARQNAVIRMFESRFGS
jgi:hypothetical protein